MKVIVKRILLACFFVHLSIASAFSDNKFHLSYELRKEFSDSEFDSGVLLVHLVNNTNSAIKDVTVWIQGPNKVTFDNRSILIYDIEAFQTAGAIDLWKLPVEVTNVVIPDQPAVWRVEYTDINDQRLEADVVGHQVK